MTPPSFQRARRPEQKQQRRAAILDAADQLRAEDGVDAVSLNAIARRAGLSKSNVYRYFESREQIFLTLLLDDMASWAGEVAVALGPLAGRNSPAAAAEIIAGSFVGRPRLCELYSVLCRDFERNVSPETVVEFRTRTSVDALGAADGLQRAVPSISVERCLWAVRAVFALVSGLWPLTRLSPTVEATPLGPELRRQQPDFNRDLSSAVRALLYGLQVEGWRKSGQSVDPV